MKEIPQNVSGSTKRLNPHLYSYTTGIAPTGEEVTIITKPKKRIRQSTKPLMNKLESEWLDHLKILGDRWIALDPFYRRLISQAITFRLANGLRYTPDIFSFGWPHIGELERPTAWEVKGGWFTDDANAKLKMFASAYPEIRVILAWKDKIQGWKTQRVLP